MLGSELAEGKQNAIDFSVFSEPVVAGFLGWIYTDKTPPIQVEYAEEWLKIADMYQLEGLKADAGLEIGNKLTVENAVPTFHMAYLYNAKILQELVTKFIKKWV